MEFEKVPSVSAGCPAAVGCVWSGPEPTSPVHLGSESDWSLIHWSLTPLAGNPAHKETKHEHRNISVFNILTIFLILGLGFLASVS